MECADAYKTHTSTLTTVIHTINTGGHGPSGASNLSREAGTFDSLRSLLNLVLVAAAMGSDHLTRPCLHMHCERERAIHAQLSIPD